MKTLVFNQKKSKEIIDEIVSALRQKKLVILPTDTVYGIMALATSDKAVGALYRAKKRETKKPTALLVSSVKVAQKYLGDDIVSKLGERFWPGALTIVSNAKTKIGHWPKIGVRVPDEPFLLKILEKLSEPVMASSANIAGENPPINLSEVSKELARNVALAVDRGPTKLAQASTVIEIEGNAFKIIRPGPITKKQLKQNLDNSPFAIRHSPFANILFMCYGNTCRSPMAEAMFNKMAEDRGLAARASSAGTMAFSRGTAAPNSITVMAERGIDLKAHRTRLLENEMLDEADLILAMDNSQLQAIPMGYKDKVFLLSSYASGEDEEIFDPIGGDLEIYKSCATLLEKHLINLINRISNGRV